MVHLALMRTFRTVRQTRGHYWPKVMDFTYKPCKGYREVVIGETQKGEEDGLAPCTFPAPLNRNYLQVPHIPFVGGASSGQSTNLGHETVD